MTAEIEGIQVQIIRKPIRNIHLYVKAPDGRVEVTAPVSAREETILLFVKSKAGWIRATQDAIRAQPHRQEPRFESGEPFWFLGKRYRLRVETGRRGSSFILQGDEAVLTVPEKSSAGQREAWINEWYRSRLKQEIEEMLPGWTAATGLRPSSWQIRNMKTRWGSCSTRTKKIRLNLQLAKKPAECLSYVILHELAHLKVSNHGPEFKAILDRYMPDWRRIRKELNAGTADEGPERPA